MANPTKINTHTSISNEPIYVVKVLPGDAIDPGWIPTSKKKQPLRLGPGLRHVPPGVILPTTAGQLVADHKKNSVWVEHRGGRYVPATNDLVIGQVLRSGQDAYLVSLSPYTAPASLPNLAFESASKKARPQLAPGSLVYARVSLADRHVDAELECLSPATGRALGLGPLQGGTVLDVSAGFARRLLMMPPRRSGLDVLDMLGAEGLVFATVTGRNGKVWVTSESVRTVVLVVRALRETDEHMLSTEAQEELVKRLIKEMMI